MVFMFDNGSVDDPVCGYRSELMEKWFKRPLFYTILKSGFFRATLANAQLLIPV